MSRFFATSRHYLVVGASKNPSSFGHKVFVWYLNHDLPVTPINPTSSTILNIPTAKSVQEAIDTIDSKDGFSISFITPPTVTSNILKELIFEKKNIEKLKAFWFQPGSFDSSVIEQSELILPNGTIIDDDCILTNGENLISKAQL